VCERVSHLPVHKEVTTSSTTSPLVLAEKAWLRVHIDYAGLVEGKMFLLIVDAYSKWLEVHATSTSTSAATIELLRKSFAVLTMLGWWKVKCSS